MAEIPPLRVTQQGGGFNQIPVFEMEFSGATLSKLSPTKIRLTTAGAQGPSGPAGASGFTVPLITDSGGTGRATIGSAHTVLGVNSSEASLTYYAILASNNATVTKVGTSIFITATTADISGKQNSITFPLIVTSGGTGRSTAGSATTLIGMNSSGVVYDYYNLLASDNTTVVRAGTGYFISATTALPVTYAATGNSYVVISAAADLTAERVLTAGTGINLTDAGANGAVTLSVDSSVRTKSAGFFAGGNLSTAHQTEEARVFIPYTMSAQSVYLAAGNAPTGSNIIVNVQQWNATLAASTAMFAAANRPFILSGNQAGSSLTFDINTLYKGSWLGISIDQVGSTAPGSNLTVNIISALT